MHSMTADFADGPDLGCVINDHFELVKRIAWRLYRRLPGSVDVEDLVQAGVVGLIEAHARYEEDEQASFPTFAGIRIRGAMLDEIRRGDWAPRSLHRATRALKHAKSDVERRIGRSATGAAIAKEMGMEMTEYRRLCDDIGLVHVASLDAVMAEQPALEVSANEAFMPDAEVEYQDLCGAVLDAAKTLPEREQTLLKLYYESGENLRQIAERMGVSESRACQLHGRAIRQLRELLGEAA